MAKRTGYVTLLISKGQELPALAAGGANNSYSVVAHETQAGATAYAKRNVGQYDCHVFRLESIVRIKPVPVEIEQVSVCEDAEG